MGKKEFKPYALYDIQRVYTRAGAKDGFDEDLYFECHYVGEDKLYHYFKEWRGGMYELIKVNKTGPKADTFSIFESKKKFKPNIIKKGPTDNELAPTD